jgi:WD40 repeat protein
VLPDGRVVTGENVGRVLAWDPARAGSGPVELGRHDRAVRAVAVLPDGRVVSGGDDGRVLAWDPARAGSGPVELGRHDGTLRAVPDGRVVSGGDDRRALVWDVTTRPEIAELGCSVTALATGPLGLAESSLVVAHAGAGFSLWSVIGG